MAVAICVLFAIGTVIRRRGHLAGQAAAAVSQTSLRAGDIQPDSVTYTAEEDLAWTRFQQQYNKVYASLEEERRRRGYFHARMQHLNGLNAVNGEPVFGVTVNADREPHTHAFSRGRKGNGYLPRDIRVLDFNEATKSPELQFVRHFSGEIQQNVVDWRRVPGVLTPVKNQGQCGSCWAFSVAEQVEAQLVLSGTTSVELSPQQITSCTSFCLGCGGGDTTLAYDYLSQTIGLAPDAYWPYTQGMTPQGECLALSCTAACSKNADLLREDFYYIGPYARVQGYSFVIPPCGPGEDCALQNLDVLARVLKFMPVSICLNAAHWDDYVGGVLSLDACGGIQYDDLDHCVSLVGYNNDTDVPYWLVRNSWSVHIVHCAYMITLPCLCRSTSWGESGYIRLDFRNNTCGLANEATIAYVSVGGPARTSPLPVLPVY